MVMCKDLRVVAILAHIVKIKGRTINLGREGFLHDAHFGDKKTELCTRAKLPKLQKNTIMYYVRLAILFYLFSFHNIPQIMFITVCKSSTLVFSRTKTKLEAEAKRTPLS